METLLDIFGKKPQEEVIDEQKLRYLASKVGILDHFGIPQAHYLALDTNEKSKMLSQYCKNLLPAYFGDGKNDTIFCLNSVFYLLFGFWILACFWMVFENFILCILVDSGISDAVKGSTKPSMTKSVFDGRMETTITAEKDPAGFKCNSTDL